MSVAFLTGGAGGLSSSLPLLLDDICLSVSLLKGSDDFEESSEKGICFLVDFWFSYLLFVFQR